MDDPTVYIVIDNEACALTERGEVLCTAKWNAVNEPIWDEDSGIADHRGGGGHEGYLALVNCLRLAEKNARLCGFDIKRLED